MFLIFRWRKCIQEGLQEFTQVRKWQLWPWIGLSGPAYAFPKLLSMAPLPQTITYTSFIKFVENIIDSLIGIAKNLSIDLGRRVIFTVLILLIQEHGVSLHLFVSSLISFISDLKFSAYKSLVPVFIVQLLSCVQLFVTHGLRRLIPRYLILFVALMDGIISLISLSDFSLLLFSLLVVSDSLWPYGLQHARLPCLSFSPKVWDQMPWS